MLKKYRNNNTLAVLSNNKYSFLYFLIALSTYCNSIIITCNAQDLLSNAAVAEKIYLQLDKDTYTTGTTIWFKAIVTNSFDNTLTDLSRVLYVELIDSNETIMEKKLLRLKKGIGEGYFNLPESLRTGYYAIRAYTVWNKNFGSDFMFQTYIQIFSMERVRYDPPFSEDPSTKMLKKLRENIPSSPKVIDLQFMPESGKLVNGLPSKIGFKAVDAYGKGIAVEGTVVDGENNTKANFKSNSLGMGSFSLKQVDITKKYYAKLSNQEIDSMYALPQVAPVGDILSVIEKENTIILTGLSNYMESDSIYLTASSNGMKIIDTKLKLQNGTFRYTIENDKLPNGIIVFSLLNTNYHKLAQRLFFNTTTNEALRIDIRTPKNNYSKRELTHLSIETIDKKGMSTKANMSILVLNKAQLGAIQHARETILTYFLLSSELKGYIENPGYYFNGKENKKADLDALMLTQGWRNYKYGIGNSTFNFEPESNLTLSGSAELTDGRSKNTPIDLTMITYGKEDVLYTQTTDSLGRFKFNLDDEFGHKIKALISGRQSGKRVGVHFIIDENISPPIKFNQKIALLKNLSTNKVLIEKDMEKKTSKADLFIPSDHIALNEVLITGRKLTPVQKKVIDRFGEPDKIIEGSDLKEKEKKWSSGIFDILHYNFQDKVHIIGRDSIQALNGQPTMVVVDGVPVYPYEYGDLQYIQASEVTSIEVIEFAKFYKTFCIQVFSNEWKKKCVDPKKGSEGNIVAIYTKAQKGIHGAYNRKSKSLGETIIPVFSESREFYAPRYDTMPAKDSPMPDLRALIYWQPILETNDTGTATTSFYNVDIPGDMMVIVEAITENGTIAYKEYTYKVE